MDRRGWALFVGGACHDENRIAAYAKLVEIVEEDIQSRLEKGEIMQGTKKRRLVYSGCYHIRRGKKGYPLIFLISFPKLRIGEVIKIGRKL